MKVKLQILISLLFGLLSACTGLDPERYLSNKQSFMINQGNPPSYAEGYIDGCSAGRRLAGDKHFIYRKNATRFDKEALYAKGWQDGQINCRNEVLEEEQFFLKEKIEALSAKTPTHSKAHIKAAAHHEKISEIDAERQKRIEAESRAAETEMHEIWEELKK